MKTVLDSYIEQAHTMRYQFLNSNRSLFGGVLMQWIDEVAGLVASRHSGCMVTTAAVDHLVFREPAYLEDSIYMTGRVTYVGKTSMEVRVDSYAVSIQGQRRLINRAYLVLVALDEERKPAVVPQLQLHTEEEEQEWAQALKRNERRREIRND